MFRKILWVLLGVLIIIQFIHPKKNKAEGAQPNYVGNSFPVPQDVKHVLDKACLDCHSNNSSYPWYSKFQPVDWWLNGHIKKGKKGLNLDEYTNKPLRYQYHKMEEVVEMVEEKEMPINSYTWTHRDARLTDDERLLLIGWARGIMDTMKAQYPLDSLVSKK